MQNTSKKSLDTISHVPDSVQSEKAEKKSAAAQDKAAIDSAKEQVLVLYEASNKDGYNQEAHRNDIASLAGLNPEGVSQGIQEIQKRVHADRDVRRDKEKALTWFEEETRPGRGINPRTLSEINDLLPERILWHCDDEHGGILMHGELAILTGEGGTGKSRLALQWALQSLEKNVGETGIRIRPGNVVYMTYEDVPAEVKRRAKRILKEEDSPDGEKELPDGFFVLDMIDNPLFTQPVGAHESSTPVRCKEWEEIWKAIRGKNPSLVIIDPIAEAYRCAGYSVSGVRSFIAALRKEAQQGEFGILLLAHSNKAARSKDADPFDPGQVAGSAGWTDAVRGVLSLKWENNDTGTTARNVCLRCNKANYGSSRWETYLTSKEGGAWTQAKSSSEQAGRKAREVYGNGKSVNERIKGIFG